MVTVDSMQLLARWRPVCRHKVLSAKYDENFPLNHPPHSLVCFVGAPFPSERTQLMIEIFGCCWYTQLLVMCSLYLCQKLNATILSMRNNLRPGERG